MTTLFGDSVSIDTNVFLHILNPQQNVNSHIDELLAYLQEHGVALVVDDRNRIAEEYRHQIEQEVLRSNDVRNEIYILRYWILAASRIEIAVNLTDRLMHSIRGVIVERSERVDQIFVYVAFNNGSILISNDERHIVVGPIGESRLGERRRRLLRVTRRLRAQGADILTSLEAYRSI